MAITLEIATVDRSDFLKINTARISRDLNGRSSFHCVLEERKRGYRPSKGQILTVKEGAVKRFSGHIYSIVERAHPDATATKALQFDLECRDFNQIAARRLVAHEYDTASFYGIVKHIADEFMKSESISVTDVENPGPTITGPLRFNYESVESAYNRISAITGRLWSIDFDKVLHFKTFASVSAPFGLTSTAGGWYDFEVEDSDEDYRNRQFVRSESRIQATLVETFVRTATPGGVIPKQVIQELLSVKINGTAKTFLGVDPLSVGGIPTGVDFYYIIGSYGVFDRNYVAVNGDIQEVRYSPPFTNVVLVESLGEQSSRATLEQGSGIWEAIEEQRNVNSVQVLTDIGTGRLRQFGVGARKPSFKTRDAGLEPGQRISINIPAHSINSTFLIERVDYNWVAARSDFFEHSVQCTSVEPFGNPVDFLEKLVEVARIGPPLEDLSASPDTGALPPPAVWHIRGSLVAGDNETNHHECSHTGIPFAAIASTVDGQPSSECRIDVTHVGTGLSIFAGNKLVLAAGQQRSDPVTFPSPVPTFAYKDFLKLNVITPGGAKNVQITVLYR